MVEPVEQTYATHRRFVPLYHFVAAALFVLNLVYAVIQLLGSFTWGGLVHGLTAVALLILYWYARTFATGVQDRVIRLEERLRLQDMLQPDLRARIPELTTRQLVALRFASDGELGGLVRRVFDERIDDAEAIKRLIVHWRPDHCRV